MSLKSLLFSAAFIILAHVFSTAQTSFVNTPASTNLDNWSSDNLPEITGENWTFYFDKENKVYYIDFETIKVNLNDIRVKNQKGEIVLEDNLWELPVNTIYELNLKDLAAGIYEVELRTYTGVMSKTLEVD